MRAIHFSTPTNHQFSVIVSADCLPPPHTSQCFTQTVLLMTIIFRPLQRGAFSCLWVSCLQCSLLVRWFYCVSCSWSAPLWQPYTTIGNKTTFHVVLTTNIPVSILHTQTKFHAQISHSVFSLCLAGEIDCVQRDVGRRVCLFVPTHGAHSLLSSPAAGPEWVVGAGLEDNLVSDPQRSWALAYMERNTALFI